MCRPLSRRLIVLEEAPNTAASSRLNDLQVVYAALGRGSHCLCTASHAFLPHLFGSRIPDVPAMRRHRMTAAVK